MQTDRGEGERKTGRQMGKERKDMPAIELTWGEGSQGVTGSFPWVASVHPNLPWAQSEGQFLLKGGQRPSEPGVTRSLELSWEVKSQLKISQVPKGLECGRYFLWQQSQPTPSRHHPQVPASPVLHLRQLTLEHLHSHLQHRIFFAQTKGRGLHHLPKGTSSKSLTCHTHMGSLGS